ncbi:hypothetical protein CRM22_004568 [Opisthorchis felineus]|uniref:Glycoside hydrolase family 19 catalytic domain-containing protein n=1 Tax=Opisthorchis felineus TaxID=147828 RepID=A0A4S2LVI5_OPIFE|nr:hypothetical protein CRM22_004568 [Opisthorchis felineus]
MVEDLISRRQWEQLVANGGYYSYDNFTKSAKEWQKQGFLNYGTIEDKRRELAAFLANAAHETGNFQYIEECVKSAYAQPNQEYPVKPGRRYYGRGPLQLTWNYNYGSFSEHHYGDKHKLLDDPGKVAESGSLGFSSAIWFWMTQPTSSRSAHRGIYQDLCAQKKWGFGRTIMAINGGLEGDKSEDEDSRVRQRISFYRQFARTLKVTIGQNGEQLDTKAMKS